MQETRVQSLGQEDPLEKGLATRSSFLGWTGQGCKLMAGAGTGGGFCLLGCPSLQTLQCFCRILGVLRTVLESAGLQVS